METQRQNDLSGFPILVRVSGFDGNVMILAHGSASGAPLFSSQGFPAPPMRYFNGDVCVVRGGGAGGGGAEAGRVLSTHSCRSAETVEVTEFLWVRPD